MIVPMTGSITPFEYCPWDMGLGCKDKMTETWETLMKLLTPGWSNFGIITL